MREKKKKCARCKKDKPFGDFYFYASGKPYSYCKKCERLRSSGPVYDSLKVRKSFISVFSKTEITDMLSCYLDLSESDFITRKANAKTGLRKHIIMYFLKKTTNASLKEIADCVNLKDHTTTIYAIKKIISLRKMYPSFDKKLKRITDKLKENNRSYFLKYKWLDVESKLEGTVQLQWRKSRRQKARTAKQKEV